MRCKQRGCLFAIIKTGKRIAVMTALQLDSDSSQMFTTFLFMIQHDNSWTVQNKWMVITTCGIYTSTSLNRVCKKFHFNTSQRRALKLKWSSSTWQTKKHQVIDKPQAFPVLVTFGIFETCLKWPALPGNSRNLNAPRIYFLILRLQWGAQEH